MKRRPGALLTGMTFTLADDSALLTPIALGARNGSQPALHGALDPQPARRGRQDADGPAQAQYLPAAGVGGLVIITEATRGLTGGQLAPYANTGIYTVLISASGPRLPTRSTAAAN